jgi:hypothetical protein
MAEIMVAAQRQVAAAALVLLVLRVMAALNPAQVARDQLIQLQVLR